MRALVDCDFLCYAIGSATDDNGAPLAWPLTKARVDTMLDIILHKCEADSWQGYLTGAGNFRESVATIRPYKGNRDRQARPFWYQGVYDYLRDYKNCKVIHGMEADDAIAIASDKEYKTTVIVSKDKDLLQIPGWHFSWPLHRVEQGKAFFIDETEGYKAFFTQLLIGDVADNIPGLYRIGPKSQCVQDVKDSLSPIDMFSVCRIEYEHRFGSYWRQFLEENGTLLWLLRHEEDSFKKRVQWFLEEEYLRQERRSDVVTFLTRLNGVALSTTPLESSLFTTQILTKISNEATS